jgi:hypothetical protein
VNAVGGFDIWTLTLTPPYGKAIDGTNLELGKEMDIENTSNRLLMGLVLKAFVFFVIYLQIRTLNSNDYDKVMLRARNDKVTVQKYVSHGYAYLFNNEKSYQYINQAH